MMAESISDILGDINFDEMENDIANFASEPSVRSVLEVGVDLQNYNSHISQELRSAQMASIDDYLKQVGRVQELSQEIDSCDQTLESMEKLLADFKASLGQMSSDINSLQTKSKEITQKLNNRKEYESYLGEFTRNILLTREFVNEVSNSEVGLQYIRTIEILEEKIKFVKRKEVKDMNSAQEARMSLDKLKVRASDNIRKWVIARVTEIIDYPETQSIVQDVMMRCQKLIFFIKDNAADADKFSRNYYVDSLSRLYLEQFRTLARNVTQKMAKISTSDETIVPCSQPKSFFSRRKSVRESTLFFSLGERQRLLVDILAPPQEFGEGSFPVEALLRSMYMKLINEVTSEHIFSSSFWMDDSIATLIFSQTTRFLEQFLDELLFQITDPVCIVILMRFLNAHCHELDKRHVYRIDQHMSSVHRKLVSRFRFLISNNMNAIEACDLRILTDISGTAHHANALTRRFSEFASSISKLMTEENSEIIAPELHSISASIIDLFDRSTKQFSNQETADVFLINNYFLVLSTLRPIEGCILIGLFERKLNESIAHYVDLVLLSHFRPLSTIVRQSFVCLETREDPTNLANIKESELKSIAESFRDKHSSEMKTISDSQIMLFGDFTNSREILRQIAKRLVLYWTKFDQLVKSATKQYPRPQWITMMLSAQQLVLDIRPMTEAF